VKGPDLQVKKHEMLDEEAKKQIAEIWDNYVILHKSNLDAEAAQVNNIDDSRLYAIEVVKIIIHNFMKGDFNVYDFKTSLDSYNKHNNLWGFTGKLGQMYFNQLIQVNEQNIDKLTTLLKDAISEPKNLRDALSKIESLEKLTSGIYNKSKDKHNAPYPGAVGYFLSYFWQIHNHQKWPILYASLINSFNEIGIWKEHKTQKETYEFYYNLTGDIREALQGISGAEISNWDIEHTFWNYKNKPKSVPVNTAAKAQGQSSSSTTVVPVREVKDEAVFSEAFDIREYLIPRLSRLLDKDDTQEASTPQKLSYEQLVAESFSHLDFEVKVLDQDKRKKPYAVLQFREENIAFILDAMASNDDYFGQNDERLVKEYVQDECRNLRNQGYKQIGFIAVCHTFEPAQKEFANYITWNTDIRKVTLMTSEALLYLVAYKAKNRSSMMTMVEKIANFSPVITTDNVAEELA
jgi:hypothetical protein